MPSERLNISTFSKRIDLSVATVSRALNPQTAHLVKPATRERVRQLADELGFTPHAGARVLKRSAPGPITVLLPMDLGLFLSEYFARILTGILQEANRCSRTLHTQIYQPGPRPLIKEITDLTWGANGLIFLAKQLTAREVADLSRLRMPVAVSRGSLPIDLPPDIEPPAVFGFDSEKGARLATRHLLALGHRRFAFCNGPASLRDAQERARGFHDSLHAAGLATPDHLCLHDEFTYDAGRRCADRLYPFREQFTAVVCGNDEIALGLMDEFAQRGLSCPRDLSVVGHDNSHLSERHTPGLTTVRMPWIEMGKAAVELVEELR
ncbi:MAG: LacI family transcriptional regulator, partial [Opitutaceae bacterium]|nr:LacI family transcriptional regulator [Opitutaceae bacterium]